MFYPESNIDELMPDILVQDNDTAQQDSYKFSINYFLRSRTKKSIAPEFKTSFNSPRGGNSLEIKSSLQVYEGGNGTLPDCVTCHPVVEYSYRYGNIVLSGLDNNIETTTVNNGSWRPSNLF